jgi:hypothetical protein
VTRRLFALVNFLRARKLKIKWRARRVFTSRPGVNGIVRP